MKKIICDKCKIPLEKARTNFKYLDHEMHADVLRCSSCGQVYLSEEMVKDRIIKVETALEDK
jgi:RNase P subunit RPR2